MNIERIRRAAHTFVDVVCDEVAKDQRDRGVVTNRAQEWLTAGGTGAVWPALLEWLATVDLGQEVSLPELADSQGVSLRGVTGAVGRAVSRLGGYRAVPLVFNGEGEAERVALGDAALRDDLRETLGII